MRQGSIPAPVRCLHITMAILMPGSIYSPFENLPQYTLATEFVVLRPIILTGLWMWKGHLLQ